MGYLCIAPDLEQSNSSLIFGNKYFFKLYRKLFREINPEVEMLQFLTESGGFKNIPAFCGSLIYERPETALIYAWADDAKGIQQIG